MESGKRQRGCAPTAIGLGLALLLLPVVYVLSIGPAAWLRYNGYVSIPYYSAYAAPAEVMVGEGKPMNRLMLRYVQLYVPDDDAF